MTDSPVIRDLAELAAPQAGVVTRRQAERAGVSRHLQQRLVRQGYWQRLGPGLLLTHQLEPTWEALAWGGVLRCGDFARLGGLAAGYLHGLVQERAEPILVLHPHSSHRDDTERWRFRRERDGVRTPQSVGSPPRTKIEDTVLDLCDPYFEEGNSQSPEHWVTAAVQRRLTTVARLRNSVTSKRRFSIRSELEELLADVDDGSESPLERHYLRNVERPHGLPPGTRQARDRIAGRRIWRDVRYDAYSVVVELDGATGHAGSGRFRDYQRDNATLLAGEVSLRYGWHDVRTVGCRIAFQVAEMLIRGGWTGLPTRCPSCPPDVSGAF